MIVARESFNGMQIPIIQEKNELYIQAIIIAKALGYSSPHEAVRNIINRHPEEFKGLILMTNLKLQNSSISEPANLAVSFSTASNVLLHERGVYKFCMFARTEKAKMFRDWVTRVLELYRKKNQELANANPLDIIERLNQINVLTLKALREQDERLKQLERDNKQFKLALRTTSIDRFQRKKIKEKIDIIANLFHDLTKEEYKFIYPRIWSWFKNTYNITSYEDLPKSLFNDAIETLNAKIVELGGFVPEGVEK
ncbi:MAG: BRO-N domain-containing protein [Candidatus Heimdallarchaeaceae archaeon]